MPDSSIVLMGGDGPLNNETWTSIDNGATWTRVNSSSGWSMRYFHTSVAMPDGSIILMGGYGVDGALPILPVCGIVSCLFLLGQLTPEVMAIGAVLTIVGGIAALFAGRRTRQEEP
jgi:hypothetical protein